MTLRLDETESRRERPALRIAFTFLGYEYASVRLDIERHEPVAVASIAERGIKAMSKVWIKGMLGG